MDAITKIIKARNAMRVAGISSALFVTGGLGVVGAAPTAIDYSASNTVTGFNSINRNRLDVDSSWDLDIDNEADSDLWFSVMANTGGNDQNENTVAGGMDTGDIDIEGDVENHINAWATSTLAGMGGDQSVSIEFMNDTTGANSENINRATVNNSVDIDIDNEAAIETDIRIEANTGGNRMNRNTEGGNLSTGDVNVEISSTNHANTGAAAAAAALAGGKTTVNVETGNDTTGANSENTNTVEIDNDVEIDIDNDAKVETDIRFEGNTGDNTANRNTKGGSISTGDVNFSFSSTNHLN